MLYISLCMVIQKSADMNCDQFTNGDNVYIWSTYCLTIIVNNMPLLGVHVI